MRAGLIDRRCRPARPEIRGSRPLAIAEIQIQLAQLLVRVFVFQINQIQPLERRPRLLLSCPARSAAWRAASAVPDRARRRWRSAPVPPWPWLCRPWPDRLAPGIRTRCRSRRNRGTCRGSALPSLITSSQFFSLSRVGDLARSCLLHSSKPSTVVLVCASSQARNCLSNSSGFILNSFSITCGVVISSAKSWIIARSLS